MLHNAGLSGIATLALPISITAAAALVVQFVAFGAAAREAQAAAPAGTLDAGRAAARRRRRIAGPRAACTAARPRRPPAARRRDQCGKHGPTRGPGLRPPPPAAAALHDLASYAGLYQRLFVGLLMAWTLLVALGIAPN